MSFLKRFSVFLLAIILCSCALSLKIQNSPTKTLDILRATEFSIQDAHDHEWIIDEDYNIIEGALCEAISVIEKTDQNLLSGDIQNIHLILKGVTKKIPADSHLVPWINFLMKYFPGENA